jgi:hypothetical protein
MQVKKKNNKESSNNLLNNNNIYLFIKKELGYFYTHLNRKNQLLIN